jgi:hypothetical protein
MRKTRSDAVLLNLPEEQQAKLAAWLLAGVPYHEAKVLAEKEFGVVVRSLDSFRSFWQQVCQPQILARRRRAVTTASERAEEAKSNPGQFDVATMDAIKQRAYELAESPESRPGDVKAILMLLLKARDQDRQERELDLALSKYRDLVAERRRAIEAELGKAKDNGGITTETRERIERELKLL